MIVIITRLMAFLGSFFLLFKARMNWNLEWLLFAWKSMQVRQLIHNNTISKV